MSRARDLANLGDGITGADLPAGSVLQVIQGTTTTSVATTSTTPVDTGLSVSITPTSESSKILVFINQSCNNTRSAANNGGFGLRLLRGATEVEQFNGVTVPAYTTVYLNSSASPSGFMSYVAVQYLDAPSTTSEVTYKTQGAVGAATLSPSLTFQTDSTPSFMTLMEIAG
jgi:hypothetical protein